MDVYMCYTGTTCLCSTISISGIPNTPQIHLHCFADLEFIARKSALEKTQLSDVLITDNLF